MGRRVGPRAGPPLHPGGQFSRIVEVPAPHTSSVAFAGPGLDTLVITTATQDLTEQQRIRYTLSGRLFTLDPGVRGLPQQLWSGQCGHNPAVTP